MIPVRKCAVICCLKSLSTYPAMCKKVDIIVVNWNSGEKTLAAVKPYVNYKSSAIDCNVIVVDNASTDNSLLLFKNVIDKVIINDRNLGFGAACNQALNGCTGDYILLLNPDTISDPLVLEKLVLFLEKNRQYGITGPSQVDENGNVIRTCGRFPSFKTAFFQVLGLSKIFPKLFTPAPIMTDWDHLQSRDVDHVMGSYMLIRRQVLSLTGFMDDEYFVYLEDIDLSKRFRNAGFKSFYNKELSIYHECGGTGQKLRTYRLFYSLSSRRLYWKKHLGKANYLILTALSLTVEPILKILESLIVERDFRLIKTLKGYFMYFKNTVSFK